ncbi:tail fiber protein [Bartonella sp. A05]|uniref:tail fiber protein n=1 Tax=Bartonella sp. A05 TaxID=2967261 RepID=UPI0022A961FD|nr:tail fiber protein [Bartonella sp. A05]MCZ2203723.1 phage tail protein [Bartonella sp. A05]
MSSIYDWSLIALENARADEIINWAEGQPPSSVNDSARVMMQRVREYMADQGGAIETKFAVNNEEKKTSIRLITKSPIIVYTNDIVVRFKSQGVNIGATNVAINQLSAQPVYKVTQNGIEPLSGGEIQKGGIYELIYHQGITGKSLDGWYLTNPTIEFSTSFPAGLIATFAMEKLPEGWILCDGKAYLRKQFANLFSAIGEIWGKGDGTTTFNVPDLRGMFLRGLDNEKGIDKGRTLGSRQEDSFKAHTHTGKTKEAGAHTHTYEELSVLENMTAIDDSEWRNVYSKFRTKNTSRAGNHSHEIILNQTGGEETRPVNVAVVYAIKT